MNLKANKDGTYEATFNATELTSIVRIVKQNEIWRREEADKVVAKLEDLEIELIHANKEGV